MKYIRDLVTLDGLLEPRQSGIQAGRVFAGLTMARPQRSSTYNCIIYIVIILLYIITVSLSKKDLY